MNNKPTGCCERCEYKEFSFRSCENPSCSCHTPPQDNKPTGKCVPAGYTLASDPPQYRCIHCSQTWFCHKPAPDCPKPTPPQPKPDTEPNLSKEAWGKVKELTEEWATAGWYTKNVKQQQSNLASMLREMAKCTAPKNQDTEPKKVFREWDKQAQELCDGIPPKNPDTFYHTIGETLEAENQDTEPEGMEERFDRKFPNVLWMYRDLSDDTEADVSNEVFDFFRKEIAAAEERVRSEERWQRYTQPIREDVMARIAAAERRAYERVIEEIPSSIDVADGASDYMEKFKQQLRAKYLREDK